ncbi:MAG TPA: KamA family radical SAM protein [Bacteroidetes bacterium]|nr:KamA family radical SAM protein [Bacteroidota bacterium]
MLRGQADIRHPRRVRYLRRIDQVAQLSEEERRRLRPVCERYAFRANDYYLNLINWADPKDPIRRLVIPSEDELEEWGKLDVSHEADYTVAPGVQHKYPHTVLILATMTCAAYCRYCFRKRLFMPDSEETAVDFSEGIEYIARHPEVQNVLLSGGDPLVLSTGRLEALIARLRAIDHVGVIRIGSKVPSFNPLRLLDDRALFTMFARYSTPRKRIYLMSHFTHPRELTTPAIEVVHRLLRAGVIIANQTPLLAGINDDPDVLGELWLRLSEIGATPYYLFVNRPTAGNAPFRVPLTRGYQLFQESLTRVSGLGRRLRYTMSHATGKVEIIGVDDHRIYIRYHRAAKPENAGRFLAFHRDDQAYWLDDLVPVKEIDARRGNGRAHRLARG